MESDEDCTGTDDERICAPPIQEFDLERIIPHEGFSVKSNNKVHDIALVQMSGDAQYSNFVAPICLPEPGCVANMKRLMDGVLIASGWGKTENCKFTFGHLTKFPIIELLPHQFQHPPVDTNCIPSCTVPTTRIAKRTTSHGKLFR